MRHWPAGMVAPIAELFPGVAGAGGTGGTTGITNGSNGAKGAAGVTIAVCGQAAAEHHFDYDWIDSSVTISLSALTTITTLEQQGYGLMPM